MLLAMRLASSSAASWLRGRPREFLLLVHSLCRHHAQNQAHRRSDIGVRRPYLCQRHHRHCSLDKFFRHCSLEKSSLCVSVLCTWHVDGLRDRTFPRSPYSRCGWTPPAVGGSKLNSLRTSRSAEKKDFLQALETRIGIGRANQFDFPPTLPTKKKSAPLSLRHDLRFRRGAIIFLSS